MKKLVTILGITAAVLTTVLATLPIFKLAFIPAAIALAIGILRYVKSRQENSTDLFSQLIIVVTIVALTLVLYKLTTITPEIGDTKQLEQREKASEKNAIEELEDIEMID